MFLNMWMVANRLSVLKPDLHLNDEEVLEIKGVRLYSTVSGYIHVFMQEQDCICAYKQEYFVLHDIDLVIAFGILQEVFEFYENWEREMRNQVMQRNFQRIADSSTGLLDNPFVILDDNYKVMGISSQFKANEVDGEWKYLYENGYSSIRAVRELRKNNVMADANSREKLHVLPRIKLETFGYSNIYQFIRYENIICGRLVILEKNRMVNPGDMSLLQIVADLISPYIQISDAADYSYSGNSVFNLLLDEKPLEEDVLAMQLKYYGWHPDDNYYLLLIDFSEAEKDPMPLQLMRIAFLKHASECYTMVHHEKLVVVGNGSKCSRDSLIAKIEDIIERNEAVCYCSLILENIQNTPYLYHQVLALSEMRITQQEAFVYFENFAMDYILTASNPWDKIYASAPDIRRYFQSMTEKDMHYINAIKVFLCNHESLIDAAKKLFVHRNTMVYRLNKAKELLNLNFESGEACMYYLISIRLLEQYQDLLHD